MAGETSMDALAQRGPDGDGIAAGTAEGSRIVPSALAPRQLRPAAVPRRRGTTALSGGHLGPGRLTTIVVFCRLNDDRSPSRPAPAVPASYEVALSELESLVASMEGGQLPLEGLLASYRRGTELLSTAVPASRRSSSR
jgi:exodeoxyribonuclease VII small subunit